MRWRLISAVLLVAYGALLVKIMVLKDMPLVRIGQIMLNFGGTAEGQPNFIPFKTIIPYLVGHKGLIIAGINLVGNIVLLVPLGFLLPFIYRGISWQKSLASAVVTGLVIEVAQVLLRVGIFDIDDVILNALGFMIGYWIYILVGKLVRSKNGTLILGIGSVIVVAALAYGYQKYPVSLEPAVINGEGGMTQGRDLCGGTGGNGQVVDVGNNAFTIERGSGGIQTVILAGNAEINTPAGPGTIADLKTGDRVTLVGGPNAGGSFDAEAVFVCGS